MKNRLPVTKRGAKARPRPLDADCCSGTIKCRSRGINSQSHFAPRFVPLRLFLDNYYFINFSLHQIIHYYKLFAIFYFFYYIKYI